MTLAPARRFLFSRQTGVGLLLFLAAFLWFWFWRPYGLWYGGDSEYLDRQVNGGLWFRKREPLAVAAMQLARQVFTLGWGWPVAWAISLVSCLAGAAAVVCLWQLARHQTRPYLFFTLALFSGHALLYHGSIEAYALPTAVLCLWILSLDRVYRGDWSSGVLPLVFALMTWCHVMALFLFPALVLSAWLLRNRILRQGEWRFWVLGALLTFAVYVFVDVLRFGEGLGFGRGGDLLLGADGENQEWGPFLSMRHLGIKVYFLWLGTHISLPFALAGVAKNWRDPFHSTVGVMAACALFFLIAFHPDTGYRDWDLFALPSLPLAILGATYIQRANLHRLFALLWIAAFFMVWVPRIPLWARLSERGLGSVTITNFPQDRTIKLDGRYVIHQPTFRTQGGFHNVSVERSIYISTHQEFFLRPGDEIEVEIPISFEESPLAEKIRAIEEETKWNAEQDDGPEKE